MPEDRPDPFAPLLPPPPETTLAVGLLELVTLVSGTAAAGRETRGLLCQTLAPLFDAPAAAHALIDLPSQHAELYLWRQASAATGAAARLEVPEPGLAKVPETARWFASAARRSLHQWIDLPHLAELPVTVDLGRLCYLVLGRRRPFDGDDERLLALAGRHLAALEAVRWRLAPVEPAGHRDGEADAPPIHLTGREVEVLLLLREGLLARAIAGRLGLSERTVHKHLSAVYTKLGVHDRLLAVRRAEDLGLVGPPPPGPGLRRSA